MDAATVNLENPMMNPAPKTFTKKGSEQLSRKQKARRDLNANMKMPELDQASVPVSAKEAARMPYDMVWQMPDGTTVVQAARPVDGMPVEDPEKAKHREILLSRIGELEVPGNPLDQIVLQFGHTKVAELTGRKNRLVRDPRSKKLQYTSRTDNAIENEHNEFLDGKRRVAIISRASAEGIDLHAGKNFKNQQPREHFMFELGWNTKDEVQKAGRTHRSNEVVGPTYTLVSINIGGDKRFSSALAANLAQLGAIQRGDRSAAGAGELAKYDFNSVYGMNAAIQTLRRMGIESPDILSRMGLTRQDKWPAGAVKMVGTFFNRLMVLHVADQNAWLDRFMRQFQTEIENAKAAGTYEESVQDIPAVSIKVKNQEVVYTDQSSKAESTYYELEAELKNNRLTWSDARQTLKWYEDNSPGIYTNTKGTPVIAFSTTVTDRSGSVRQKVRVIRANGTTYLLDPWDLQKWQRVPDMESARAIWADNLAKMPATRTESYHVIAGLTLPIKDRMHGQVKVVRVPLDTGERIVGNLIDEDSLDVTLRDLGVGAKLDGIDAASIFRGSKVMAENDHIMLAGNLTLIKASLYGNRGVEIKQGDWYGRISDPVVKDRLRAMGAVESGRFEGDKRFFVPDEKEAGITFLEQLLERHPVVELPDSLTGGKKLGHGGTGASSALHSHKAQGIGGQKPPVRGNTMRDVTTAEKVANARAGIKETQEDILNTIAPGSRSAESRAAKTIIRNKVGERVRSEEVAYEELNDALEVFDKLIGKGQEARIRKFIHDFETTGTSSDGELGKYTKLLNHYATLDRELTKTIEGKEDWDRFVEHYLPHIYKDPAGAQRVFAILRSKRPLAGQANWMKKRSIPTYEDAQRIKAEILQNEKIDIGGALDPLTWNPVELVMIRHLQVLKFVMGNRIMSGFKAAGIAKFFRAGEIAPEDWKPIEDSIAIVYGDPNIEIKEGFDELLDQSINRFIRDLNVTHTRKTKIGGRNRWGFYENDSEIVTKFGGTVAHLIHELGHILNERYNLEDYLLKSGPKARRELKALADLRFEGTPKDQISEEYQKYVRKSDEKVANLIHAVIYAPEKAAAVAPWSTELLRRFVKKNPELAPLYEIKPSLVMGERTNTVNAGGMLIRGRYQIRNTRRYRRAS